MAFEQAVKVGLLSKNIVKDTEPPALTKKQINPLTPEQVANLLQILDYEADNATTNKILKESTSHSNFAGNKYWYAAWRGFWLKVGCC